MAGEERFGVAGAEGEGIGFADGKGEESAGGYFAGYLEAAIVLIYRFGWGVWAGGEDLPVAFRLLSAALLGRLSM